MKKKLYKIWGVGLALVLAITLSLGLAVPAAANDYPDNEWGTWGMPAVDPGTNIGPFTIAPDGTMYAAVEDGGTWMVMISEDGGYTWDETNMDDANGEIAQIVVSPDYANDETVYVGVHYDFTTMYPVVYRLPDAGGSNPIALKQIVDSSAGMANYLWSLDVWNDGDDNWVMVGTDIDVLVLQDAPFGTWVDQELNMPGFEVNFAPDFDDSQLIWVVTDNGMGDFYLTSTVAPGMWGQVIDPAEFTGVSSTYWLDIDFPDDYTSDVGSDVPIVYAALTEFGADSGVYMVECVADDGDANADSVVTALNTGLDMVSIDISGEVILAGALMEPTVWRSEDLGWSWGEASRNPTGGSGDAWTHVVMASGAFDPDDGTAYVATWGAESAFSVSNDGADLFNQIGLIDTTITDIEDIAFDPAFPSTPTYLMITYDGMGPGTYSLWVTENGDVDEPDYERVLCGFVPGAPGNFAGEFDRLTYTPDGDNIFMSGWDAWAPGANVFWKSTNGGDTFGSKRTVGDGMDWTVQMAAPDDDLIIFATTDGIKRTINGGLSWSETQTGIGWNDLALSPDFDNDSTILAGSMDGDVAISTNSGASFDVENPHGSTGDWTYVAFAPDFADGEGAIYAAFEDGYDVQVGDEELGLEDLDAEVLGADFNDESPDFDAAELLVAPDNTLYVPDDDNGGVARLLIDEDDNEWEIITDGDIDDFWGGAWLTPGSNVIWVLDWNDPELWVIEDTLSGQVMLSSPADGFRADSEDTVALAWNEMTGADDYELCYDGTTICDLGTSRTLTMLTSATEYEWKVRVQPDAPWSSRWSDSRTFHTALGVPPWSPTPYAPGNGATGVGLMPAFSWETAETADGYQFQLNDSPVFATLVDVEVSTEAYQVTEELEYGTTYYWRVRALKGDDAISRWSEVSVFTTMEEPADPPPPPTTTIITSTTQAPEPVVLPTAIPPALLWTIVGIGAALIIAVIILIIRTRRAV